MEKITWQQMEYEMDVMKKYADHLRDIDVIIAAIKAGPKPDTFALERYKEAVLDLFIEESALKTI
jgi:hypothetical protein